MAALWLILSLPVLVILLGVVIEIGNIWLARVELENALEATALSAVKEWGDQGAPATQPSRNVGATYAAANTVTGDPVFIDPNYDGTNPNNQNALCSGNLIFGAVTTNSIPWVFDTRVQPGCGGGTVLFDATGQGQLEQDNNRLGVAFRYDPVLAAAGTLIEWVQIDFTGTPLSFVGAPTVSSIAGLKVQGQGSSPTWNQPDIGGKPFGTLPVVGGTVVGGGPGFANTAAQIVGVVSGGQKVLTFTFFSAGGDLGFQPGDRFRFGIGVTGGSGQGGQGSGDDFGIQNVIARVKFSTSATVYSATFIDDTTKKTDGDQGYLDPTGQGQLVVHASGEADLPLPETSSAGNNGQSWVEVAGGSNVAFGVRAQATAPVNSVCCRLFGATLNTFEVSACATARYVCTSNRPELIRVRPENFICPP